MGDRADDLRASLAADVAGLAGPPPSGQEPGGPEVHITVNLNGGVVFLDDERRMRALAQGDQAADNRGRAAGDRGVTSVIPAKAGIQGGGDGFPPGRGNDGREPERRRRICRLGGWCAWTGKGDGSFGGAYADVTADVLGLTPGALPGPGVGVHGGGAAGPGAAETTATGTARRTRRRPWRAALRPGGACGSGPPTRSTPSPARRARGWRDAVPDLGAGLAWAEHGGGFEVATDGHGRPGHGPGGVRASR